MQITVKSIKPCDYPDQPDFPKMEAVVELKETDADFGCSAEITVFIVKRDGTLSELKNDAIQTAVNCLRSAVSAHSA